MDFIPLSAPNINGNELKYITKAVDAQWVSTGGAYIDEFENKIADYVGAKAATSCQSGTSGIHVALKLLGVMQGDLVIAPTLTFIAAVNPIKYLGADPVFMDCDDTLCMDMTKVEKFCNEECDFANGVLTHKDSGRRVKAVVVVHVFGNIANMEALMDISAKYNLKIVEDATEALGSYFTSGKYKGKFAGTIGDIGVYSFNGNKIMTTGGGGMMVSGHEDLMAHARHLTTQAKSDALCYTHDEIGYNYRMTNIQAAMGLGQLEQLEGFIKTKGENYNLYKQAFESVDGLWVLDFRKDIRPNYWFYAVYCTKPFALNRDELISYLGEKKIQSRPIWGLISDQLPYLGSIEYNIEKAKDYLHHVINIPCSSNLDIKQAEYVIECVKNAH